MYKFKQKDVHGREIILASASPRRRELLSDMGISFTVSPADCDESVPEGTHPRDAVKLLARRKALAAQKKYPDALVIAADTLVADGEIALGKPRDTDDAFNMIYSLSGKSHAVYTGLAVAQGARILVRSAKTEVCMRAFCEDEARRYADSGEGLDKAGAYGIQGKGGELVDHILGDYDNVVGLPTRLLDAMLCEITKEKKQPNVAKPIVDKIIEALKELYPQTGCALQYGGDPWRLLVMARLSAQCTDARVNMVSRELFREFPNAESMASGELARIEELVRPCGLYKHKAREIQEASRMLIRDYGGKLPDTVDELLRFPGVGRKIANLLVGDVFGKSAVVTDTHCIRICGRLGFYPEEEKNPVRIEKILASVIPPAEQSDFCHRIVDFGRDTCTARSPSCASCLLSERGICRHAIAVKTK